MKREQFSPKGLAKLQTNEEEKEDRITLRKAKPTTQTIRPLIIDLGTYTTKVGLASADISQPSECFPQLMVPTLVGQTKLLPGKLNESCYNTFVGFEALRRSSQLSLKYPMEHGIVMDWDEITQIIEHAVCECMKLDMSQLTSGLLLTESPLNPRKHRERLA